MADEKQVEREVEGGQALTREVGSRLTGAFSTEKQERVGTGTTQRKVTQKTFWFATENDEGQIDVQALNNNFMPSGPKRSLDKEEFLRRFNPEPEFYQKKVFPKMREVEKSVERAEENRAKGAMYSAEFEFQNALAVDEENVRANFGLGLTYMSMGETNKANDMFHRLVKLDAAFEKEHKHLFNEFGINLRKSGMHDQAVDYYSRALEMTENDENLRYNMARAYYEKGEVEDCVEHLKGALEINPSMEASLEFLSYLHRQGLLKDTTGLGEYLPEVQKKKPVSTAEKGSGEPAASGEPEGGPEKTEEAPDEATEEEAKDPAREDPNLDLD